MKNNEVFKAFEDMGFVFDSGKSISLRTRFINVKRFRKAYIETQQKLEEQIQKAASIEENEKSIIENARIEAARIIEEAKNQVESMDMVEEAREIAEGIIEQAHIEAKEIKEEAETISNNAIEYGENTKNKLIFQGYRFLKDTISKNVNDMDKLLSGIQENKKLLETSYAEIDEFFKDGEDQTGETKESMDEHRKIS